MSEVALRCDGCGKPVDEGDHARCRETAGRDRSAPLLRRMRAEDGRSGAADGLGSPLSDLFTQVTDIEDSLEAAREAGLLRRMREVETATGPTDPDRRTGSPAALFERLPRPGRRSARPACCRRSGRDLGCRRRRFPSRFGQPLTARRARSEARRIQADRSGGALRFGIPGEHGRGCGRRDQGRGRLLGRAEPRLAGRRMPAGRGGDRHLPARRRRCPRRGNGTGGGQAEDDRHRLGLLDGRRRRTRSQRSWTWPSVTGRR